MTKSPLPEFTYDYYAYLIGEALQAGYQFVDFPDHQKHAGEHPYICLLRHDCDNDLSAAVRMAEIEEGLGIRSTYFVMLRSCMYNLFAKPNLRKVEKILNHGHWLGLHFDPTCYEDIKNNSPELVDDERALLSREFDVPVDVVSFHQPSSKVLQNEIKINCCNTYDNQDMAGVHYLSDSNMNWHEGCPSVHFQKNFYPRLQLLLHPEWWSESSMTLEQKWNRMFVNNLTSIQGELVLNERSFTRVGNIIIKEN